MKRSWMTAAALVGGIGVQTLPSQSQTATPDTALVQIGAREAGTHAFVAWPEGKGPFPAVIVAHEWWGLNGQIREVARRLAREGYVAIVPDLYHGEVTDDPEQAHVLSRGVDDRRVVADLGAASSWLRADERVGKRKIGVMGFCIGGGWAQSFAIGRPQVAAVVMFYGSPLTEPQQLARLRAPLLAHFGQEDAGIPPDRVEALRSGLRRAGQSPEVYVYEGAGHAFMNEERPSFHPDAARQAWARTLAFLHKNLKR